MQIIVNGIALGAVYALVAAAFALIYRTTGVVNLAQGALIAIAPYFTYELVDSHGIDFWWAIVITVVLTALLGAVTQVLLLRPLVGLPITSSIMVTIGLLIVGEAFLELQWSGNSYLLPTPWELAPVELPGDARTTNVATVTVVVTVVTIALLLAFFRFTTSGTRMRAAAADPVLAELSGINVAAAFAIAWAVGPAMAAVAGLEFASVTLVSPSLVTLGLRSLPAVLVGGLDSIGGALAGGMLVGIAESWAIHAFGSDVADLTVFLILVATLLVRPYGLLGRAHAVRV